MVVTHLGMGGRGRGEGGDPSIAATVGLPLQLKQPNFNWEGNVYENYQSFSERATILLGEPYAKYDDPSKISAFLSWTRDKGFQLYKNLDWERTGYDKNKWEDVVKAFGEEFKLCQTVMQSWHQFGNLYSLHCKDQTEFMTRIKELAKEVGFTNQEEIIKFLFLIHNNNTKVREYLIDKAEPSKTSYDFLVLAKTIESQTQTESMSRKLLEKVSNTPVAGLLFKGNRLIVPKALRNKTLEVLHRSYMGITKTQERARTSFYWPGLNTAIKSIYQSCETCLQYTAKQDKQEKGLVPDCSESREALATDIFEFQVKFFLILSCRFSSYMVVREILGHTAEETIDKLSSIFAELGLPKTLHCDRGTNYTSTKFKDFCKSLNIKVTYTCGMLQCTDMVSF